jgi:hypothetical protein
LTSTSGLIICCEGYLRSQKRYIVEQRIVYRDHAAPTFKNPEVLIGMPPYFTERFGNPSPRVLPCPGVEADPP